MTASKDTTAPTKNEIKARDKLIQRLVSEGKNANEIAVNHLDGKYKKATGKTNWQGAEVRTLIKKLSANWIQTTATGDTITVSEPVSIPDVITTPVIVADDVTAKVDDLIEPDAITEEVLQLSRCYGAANDTQLVEWNVTLTNLVCELNNPKEGVKGSAGYFLRCTGTKRNNTDTSYTADILILDGDKSIDKATGEELNYAPPLDDVANALKSLNIPFVAYTSASNQPDKPKYRVLIPCRYNRDNINILLDFIFKKLHEKGVMLVDVKENRVWSQPWFFPTVDVEGGAV
jgi:hypothetical protein